MPVSISVISAIPALPGADAGTSTKSVSRFAAEFAAELATGLSRPGCGKISASGHPHLSYHAEKIALIRRQISFRYIPLSHLSSSSGDQKLPNFLSRRYVRSASFGGHDRCHPLQTKAQIDREDQIFQLASSVKPCVAPVDLGDVRFQRALNKAARHAVLRDAVAANLSENFHAVFTADLTQQDALYRERYTPRRRSLEADTLQVGRIGECKKEYGPGMLARSLRERNRFFSTSTGYMYRAIDEATVRIYSRNKRIHDPRIDAGIGISLRLNGAYFSMEYRDDLQQQSDRQQRMYLLRVPIRDLLIKGFPQEQWDTGGCAELRVLSQALFGESGAFQCLASTRDFKRGYLWKVSEKESKSVHWTDPSAACLAALEMSALP